MFLTVTDATDSAAECGMAEELCRDLLFAWAVGGNGHCLNDEFGFRVGMTGYKHVLMQVKQLIHLDLGCL